MSESEKQRPDLSVLRMDRDESDLVPRRSFPFVPLLVLLALIAGGVWAARTLPLPFLLPEVETSVVQKLTPTEASTVLTATGYTYARSRAAVGAKIIGRITELRVDEGDSVRKGQLIAILDSADIEAGVRRAQTALLETKARLADAEREEARQRRMVEAEVAPSADLDAAVTALEIARAQVGSAEAALESAEAQLEYTVITSPIVGVVIQRNVGVGEMVAPGGFTSQQSTGAIVRIADPSSLEIEADINESFIARLQLGQPASIRVDAVPDETYSGRLRQIVPTADRQRAVVEVKVAIDDRDERLVPDMSCSVTFLEEDVDRSELQAAEPEVLVKAAAVVSEGANHFVFRLTDGEVSRIVVELDEKVDEDTWRVASGLVGGETVIMDPDAELADGDRVREAS